MVPRVQPFTPRVDLPALVLTPGEAAAPVAALAIVGPRSSAAAQTATRKLFAALRSTTLRQKERCR
ncbi:MAG TPA: hypothetical protein VE953_24300 [Terriglobales bacterium]|nr:hypothetical protein [Terriglobales bacterium]